jgi:hypothetical protein
MMDPSTPDKAIPRRPGLPVDPLLQLWAGAVTPPTVYVIDAGGSVQVAVADPMRVALFVAPRPGTLTWDIAPFAAPPAPTLSPVVAGGPLVYHCRDYPGIVQADWHVSGTPGDGITVYSYTLADHWR